MKYLMTYSSLVGNLYIISDGTSIIEVMFSEPVSYQNYATSEKLEIFEKTKKWFDIYFAGKDPGFMPEIKIECKSNFQKCVLEILQKIPYEKQYPMVKLQNKSQLKKVLIKCLLKRLAVQ